MRTELPKHWCVKFTKENKEVFRNNAFKPVVYVDGVIGRYFCGDDRRFKYHSATVYGEEITFEEFTHFILKEKSPTENYKYLTTFLRKLNIT